MGTYSVLVVDDEEEFVSALVERLQLRAIDAEGVTRGDEALELLRKRDFDIILLDVMMPGIGGLEVVRRIKENHPSTAVILLSGHSSADAAEQAAAAGALEYLVKPVAIDDLISLFERISSD